MSGRLGVVPRDVPGIPHEVHRLVGCLARANLPLRTWTEDDARIVDLDPLSAVYFSASWRLFELEEKALNVIPSKTGAVTQEHIKGINKALSTLIPAKNKVDALLKSSARYPNDGPPIAAVSYLDKAISSLNRDLDEFELQLTTRRLQAVNQKIAGAFDEERRAGISAARDFDNHAASLRAEVRDRLYAELADVRKSVRRGSPAALMLARHSRDIAQADSMLRSTPLPRLAHHSPLSNFIRHDLYPAFLDIFAVEHARPSRRGRRPKRMKSATVHARASFIAFAEGFFELVGIASEVSRQTIENSISS